MKKYWLAVPDFVGGLLREAKKDFLIALSLFVAALVLTGAVLIFYPQGLSRIAEEEIKIEEGQSVRQTAGVLSDKGMIHSKNVFVWYSILSGNQGRFKAGTYIIPRRISIYNLVKIFSLGLSKSNDVVVRIPEGLNIAEIDKLFSDAGLIEPDSFLNEDFLKLEGYLFPDTYRFPPPEKVKISPEDIINKLKDNFNKKTEDLLGTLNSDERRRAVIIASVLEKEVRNFNDMRLVSGIIDKRMAIGMKLELDATVAYGACLEKLKSSQFCDVTQVNLVDSIRKDSEYNTYIREGLPAGPISNPGLISIQAALNPLESSYLFYLNTRDTGETIFSKTGGEHAENRRKYLGL